MRLSESLTCPSASLNLTYSLYTSRIIKTKKKRVTFSQKPRQTQSSLCWNLWVSEVNKSKFGGKYQPPGPRNMRILISQEDLVAKTKHGPTGLGFYTMCFPNSILQKPIKNHRFAIAGLFWTKMAFAKPVSLSSWRPVWVPHAHKEMRETTGSSMANRSHTPGWKAPLGYWFPMA